MDAKKRLDFRDTAQAMLDRHGAAHSFRLLFLLKNSLLQQWEQEILRTREKPVAMSANWFLDSVAEALLLEVFEEKS